MSVITTLTRIVQMMSGTSGQLATIPASNDHTDGTWLPTDVYPGELFINYADGTVSLRTAAGIKQLQVGTTDGVLLSVTANIPSGSVHILGDSPYTILAAPPSGYAYDIISANIKMVNGTTNYSSGVQLLINTGSTSSSVWNYSLNDAAKVLSSTGNKTFRLTQWANTTPYFTNAPITISAYNANPSGGNGSLKVNVLYRIIPI